MTIQLMYRKKRIELLQTLKNMLSKCNETVNERNQSIKNNLEEQRIRKMLKKED